MNSAINILWFKRDLRLADHRPLLEAIAADKPLLLLYIFEPELLSDPHYSMRHWRFIWQSLEDLNLELARLNSRIHIVEGEALDTFKQIQQQHPIDRIFSHEEIGLQLTFERDLRIKAWCKSEGIHWHESPCGAVIRAARDRSGWQRNWDKRIKRPLLEAPKTPINSAKIDLKAFQPPTEWLEHHSAFQHGGERAARHCLESFINERGKPYYKHISSPMLSRKSCSRLSPYLAWGNLSLAQVYNAVKNHQGTGEWERSMRAFRSRLHWHCHFMQKFESETSMQMRSMNAGYTEFPWRTDEKVSADLERWKFGQTGVPLVDACMRALNATGYINFRMRAMLVSFLCHYLKIDWRLGAEHLASQFLDFEPGIHYPQMQMQAGVTGIHTLRIYNPTKQAQEQKQVDQFIQRWVPELGYLPEQLRMTPWELTPMERLMLESPLEYPDPIVDLKQAAKEARDLFWGWREREAVKIDGERILARHVMR